MISMFYKKELDEPWILKNQLKNGEVFIGI